MNNLRQTIHRFLGDARGGATAIAAVAVTMMTMGGAALIVDNNWLTDQRDTLKAAADSAGIAATLEMDRLLGQDPNVSDANLEGALRQVARRWVEINLSYLPTERLTRARNTLVVDIAFNRAERTVDVSAEADLGGTLMAKIMPMLAGFEGPGATRVETQVERIVHPIEVVLAVDISQSMEQCLAGNYPRRCRNADRMRMTIVKRAAANLVDVLSPSVDNQVAVGVVPWHMTVRLDEPTREDWVRNGWAEYPKSRHYGATYTCGYGTRTCAPPDVDENLPSSAPEAWLGCLDEHRLDGGSSHASMPATTMLLDSPAHDPFAQAFFPATWGSSYNCLPAPLASDFNMQFCYDGTQVEQTQYIKPAQHGCADGHPAILPLSADHAKVKGAIDALDATGSLTYSALGVLWGQRLLEHGWKSVWGDPVHPVDPNSKTGTRKALVLLTDGMDTYCDLGTRANSSCADSAVGVDRTDACAAAKDAGTEIFVIAAMHPSRVTDEFEQTLRDCSSDSEDSDGTYVFLNNPTPAALEAAFADIANQLSSVRRVY